MKLYVYAQKECALLTCIPKNVNKSIVVCIAGFVYRFFNLLSIDGTLPLAESKWTLNTRNSHVCLCHDSTNTVFGKEHSCHCSRCCQGNIDLQKSMNPGLQKEWYSNRSQTLAESPLDMHVRSGCHCNHTAMLKKSMQ